MKSSARTLRYSLAINEAFHQMMAADESVFLIGQGTKSPWYVGNTAQGLLDRFGEPRVIDTPVSENAMTGAAVGAALAGMKPIVVHPRMDFMLYAFDPIINQAANWHYMNGGKLSVPVVIWGIINRGGEQAAQHSQALHAMFAHVPGLKVVMPATPYDAKGLMIAAIRDPNPVVYIDDRFLYNDEDIVPEDVYEVEIGKGIIRKEGADVTVVAISLMVKEALKAAGNLAKEGIDVEVIDLRTAKPIDCDLILASVKKTGRLVVADVGWKTCGLAAEISAIVSEQAFEYLKAPIQRVALPDCPAPASSVLEKEYYKTHADIEQAIKKYMKKRKVGKMKRFFDFSAALILMAIIAIPLFIVAVAVKLSSSGSVIHWSKRVGKDNRIFLMPKFRTMHIDAPEVATHLMKDFDIYSTSVGLFLRGTSLDELPQLWSVLKGDMSFVGPRPALFNQEDLIALRIQKGVHQLIPGITGWAQINGRDDIPIPLKVEYDEYYLKNQSFFFDMKILWKTVFKVIKKEGVVH